MNPLLETHLQTTDRKLSGVDKFRIFLPGSGNLVWTVIVTSLALMWAMGLPGAWVDYVRFSAESVATVHGRVIDSDDTNVEFNERTVSWATFKYEVDGVEHDGRAYGSEYYPSPGRRVSVGYLVDSPALARIAKLTQQSMNGPIVLGLAGFSLLLLPFALHRSRSATHWIRLLRHGKNLARP